MKGMKDYQKVMLFLYPRLDRLADSISEIVTARAVASGMDRSDTEAGIRRLIEYLNLRRGLLFLKNEMDGMLAELSEEERYLLEYKYFRRKKVLEKEFSGTVFPHSERTYFRRQKRLSAKLGGMFIRHGLDEKFFSAFTDFPWMTAALERLKEEGERAFSDKRAHSTLALAARRQKRSSASSK